jgi:hypothetical protein
VLEAGVSYILFPYENWVRLWKESILLVISRGRNIHFGQNSPIQLNWKNTCIFWNNTICVRCRSVFCLVSLWELSWFWKNTAKISTFSSERNIHFVQNSTTQLNWRNLLEQYSLCQKQECLAHCFGMWFELAFERQLNDRNHHIPISTNA